MTATASPTTASHTPAPLGTSPTAATGAPATPTDGPYQSYVYAYPH
jgi:hypothetical protein